MRVDSISPNAVDVRGGTPITLTGDLPASTPLQVRLTVNGTELLCYSGQAGQGTQSVAYGSSVTFISPAWPPGVTTPSIATVRLEPVSDPSSGVDAATGLKILPPTFGNHVFGLRGLFPPIDATGPRTLQAVQTEGGPLPGAVLPHLLDALGECFTAFGGTRSSFAAQPAAVGAVQVVVQSTLGSGDTGQLLIGGTVYSYESKGDQSYDGLQAKNSTSQGLLDAVAEGDEVALVSYNQSLIGQMHEATFLGSAHGADLSVCGRNLGLTRDPAIPDDATYARAALAIAYGPRGTMLGLRTALDAMVGPGNYTLREDTEKYPCKVFVDLPEALTLGQNSTGRTYLSGPRPQTPVDAQTFPLPAPVYGLNRITTTDLDDTQVLPGTRPVPPWQYSGSQETTDVSVHPDAPGLGCIRFESSAGVYRAARPTADAQQTTLSVTLRLTPSSGSAANTKTGIVLGVQAGPQSVAIGVLTDENGVLKLVQVDGSGAPVGTRFLRPRSTSLVDVSLTPLGATGDWEASVGGRSLRLSPIASSAGSPGAFVGRLAAADAGAPTVDVAELRVSGRSARNYAQAIGTSAQVQSGAPQQVVLEQPLAQSMQPGASIHLRGSQQAIRAPGQSTGPSGSNDGDYTVVSVDGPSSLTLRRFARSDAVLGSNASAQNQLDLPQPAFLYPADLGRQVTVGGMGSNSGTYFVAQLIDQQGQACSLPYVRACPSARLVKADGSAPNFVSQTKASVDVRPAFVSESGLKWTIDQGFSLEENGSDVLVRLWQPLPDASASYQVTYDDNLGGTIVDGTSPVMVLQQPGPPAAFNVYPAFIADPLSYVSSYINQITAAGVRAVVNVA